MLIQTQLVTEYLRHLPKNKYPLIKTLFVLFRQHYTSRTKKTVLFMPYVLLWSVFVNKYFFFLMFLFQKCPFDAITIINIPSNLEKHTTHRYSKNSFKLHRLPIPRPGEVLGLVGQNGIGKSTALKILAGKQKPNLGRFTVSLFYFYNFRKIYS